MCPVGWVRWKQNERNKLWIIFTVEILSKMVFWHALKYTIRKQHLCFLTQNNSSFWVAGTLYLLNFKSPPICVFSHVNIQLQMACKLLWYSCSGGISSFYIQIWRCKSKFLILFSCHSYICESLFVILVQFW